MSKFLTIQNLDISFQSSTKNLKTVKNFNLNLNEKESLGIVGESGSGKSLTALSILNILNEKTIRNKSFKAFLLYLFVSKYFL